MKEAPTAYSLIIMHRDVIYAVRDPYGNRPLCIGRLIPVSDINDKGNECQKEHHFIMPFKSLICSWHTLQFLDIGILLSRAR